MNREEVIELLKRIEAEFVPCDETDRTALKHVRDARHELSGSVQTEQLQQQG